MTQQPMEETVPVQEQVQPDVSTTEATCETSVQDKDKEETDKECCEDVKETAYRELEEELGLKDVPELEFLHITTCIGEINNGTFKEIFCNEIKCSI